MPTTGTVKSIATNPRAFSIDTGTPPPIAFVDPDADQWALILAAWGSGKSVTVEGTPPAVTKVKAP